jgi:transcriptional regulator
MYVPAAFAETDLGKLHDFIERHGFGLLTTLVDGLPFATHLPLLLDRSAGPNGTLIGHVARANPQWRQAQGQTALAVFSGPHAYVSPTWYESEQTVPTWNYVAVHAYGRVEVVEDGPTLLEMVGRLVEVYERSMPRPWEMPRGAFVDRLLGQIVGLRIPIDRLEGKWKLNQNQPLDRRRKVVRALRSQGGEDATAVAGLIEAMLPAEEVPLADVLRAAAAHLPEEARDLGGLFDPERLARLASRLERFTREGVPERQPPPHFSGEYTPPLAEAFAPFAEVLTAWRQGPGSPELPARFAAALTAAGLRNVLVLLGQRFTPASLADASALPPSRQTLLASAMRPHSPTDKLSVAGRALAKHAVRATGSFWPKVTGPAEQKNATALEVLQRILDGATWWNVFGHFEHVTVYEARLPSGHGGRWAHGGGEFIGFLEPFAEG